MKTTRTLLSSCSLYRMPSGWSPVSKLLGCALAVSLGASGCLSDRYRISDEELARQLQLPPEQRGQKLQVVQEIGSRAAPAVTPGAPPPPPAYAEDQTGSHVGVFVGVNMGGGGYSRPRHSYAAPPSGGTTGIAGGGGGGRPVYQAGPSGSGARAGAAPSPGTGAPGAAGGGAAGGGIAGAGPAAGGAAQPASASRGGSSVGGSKGNSTNDAQAAAVLAVVLALTAVVGAAATEGARYDGAVNVTPYQNIYLRDKRGGERVQALGDLTPQDLIGAEAAEISDAEGYGVQRLGRDPLNRKGFTLKVDAGSLTSRVDDRLLNAIGANIQFGYFFNKKLGLLATSTVTGGTDPLRRGYLRSQFGAELQGFLPGLGPLHLGGFGQGAFATTAIDDEGTADGHVLSAGGIVELELTTRLTFMFRVGYSWSNLGRQGWAQEGLGITGGLAIY